MAASGEARLRAAAAGRAAMRAHLAAAEWDPEAALGWLREHTLRVDR